MLTIETEVEEDQAVSKVTESGAAQRWTYERRPRQSENDLQQAVEIASTEERWVSGVLDTSSRFAQLPALAALTVSIGKALSHRVHRGHRE